MKAIQMRAPSSSSLPSRASPCGARRRRRRPNVARVVTVVEIVVVSCVSSFFCAGTRARASAFQHGGNPSLKSSSLPPSSRRNFAAVGPYAPGGRAFLASSLTVRASSPTRIEPDHQPVATTTRGSNVAAAADVLLEQSYPDQELGEGLAIKSASRAYVPTNADGSGEARQLCSGYLTEQRMRDDDDDSSGTSSNSSRTLWAYQAHVQLVDEEANREVRVEGVGRVIDSLFRRFLELEAEQAQDDFPNECTFEIHLHEDDEKHADESEAMLRSACLERGFLPRSPNGDADADDDIVLTFDYNLGVRRYTELALRTVGLSASLSALEILHLLSSRRVPYSFEHDAVGGRDKVAKVPGLVPPGVSAEVLDNFDEVANNGWLSATPDSVDGDPTLHLLLLSKGRPIFPPAAASTAADEGEHGDRRPKKGARRSGGGSTDAAAQEVGRGMEQHGSELWSLLEPVIFDDLLPRVRALAGPNAEVCDVFMRRYADDVAVLEQSDTTDDEYAAEDSDGERSATRRRLVDRRSIAAHYDFDMFATSVVALDDVASGGRNGMYTTLRPRPSVASATSPSSPSSSSSLAVTNGCGTTNHLALRRYFPLSRGDAIMHDWSCLHGVDIEAGRQRTSLVVWFSDGSNKEDTAYASYRPPWLDEPEAGDDIGLFLGAGARAPSKRSSSSSSEDYDPSAAMIERERRDEAHGMYVRSAELGNAFALVALGTLCAREELGPGTLAKVVDMLDGMREEEEEDVASSSAEGGGGARVRALRTARRKCYLRLPEFDLEHFDASSRDDCVSPSAQELAPVARRLWLEAAVRGEAKAQAALGESLTDAAIDALLATRERAAGGANRNEAEDSPAIDRRSSEEERGEELLELAAVLLALAAQQDHPGADDALRGVLDAAYSLVYSERGSGGGAEEFASSGIYFVAQASGVRLES